MANDPLNLAVAYHQRTKHDFGRFAAHLGYMDWATQPNPFRRFDGAAAIALAFPDADETPPYDQLYAPGATPGAVVTRPVDPATIAAFCYFSMALSAWKQVLQSQWAVRVNPSSGNLHPTEAYLLVGAEAGLDPQPCLFHYAPKEHQLERRAALDVAHWRRLVSALPAGAFLVALTSIHWRESWKYGERAYRYCQHDAGHALAALRVGAAVLGWGLVMLPRVHDGQLAALLGLDRDDAGHEHEREAPDLLAVVLPRGGEVDASHFTFDNGTCTQLARQWFGVANRLSASHHPWQAIEDVDAACRTHETWSRDSAWPKPVRAEADFAAMLHDRPCPHSAGRIIRQRRSALEMDGRTSMPVGRFHALLARLVPRLCPMPWDAWLLPVRTHLGLFVHRVAGLTPGIYVLIRDEAALPDLRAAMHPRFAWEKPAACPAALPLYLLEAGDCREHAARISCQQGLAGNGAFSLGMIAAFDEPLRRWGSPFYRHLFWETGLIGQVLYLEAEAAGVRGTGIGCFFDDPVHDTFGLRGSAWQSLYHFAVGGPIEDARILTQPPYPPGR